MRLPVVPQISTKDGTSNKNARLTNCLKESKQGGEKAVVRPGLETSDTYSGIGNGLIPFDGRLLVIYDDTVYDTEEDLTLPFPLDSDPWDAGTTYGIGDTVWYGDVLWFSDSSGNIGNTPGTGGWSPSSSTDTYEESVTYAIGDSVSYGGTTYYSYTPVTLGQTPGTNDYWSTTPPTSSRFRGTCPGFSAGEDCASYGSAGAVAWTKVTTGYSCATKYPGTYNWRVYVETVFRPGFGYFIRAHQYSDNPPYDCTGGTTDLGIADFGTVTQVV